MGFIRHVEFLNRHVGDLAGRTIVITGANSGIGFYASRYLAYKGARVVMACRNKERAERAKALIIEVVKDADIDILHIDQASFRSIEHFASELAEKYPRIDSFVFNAGIFHPRKDALTDDGFPLTIGTNYLGTFYLSHLLEPYFRKMEHVNVVAVGTLVDHKVNCGELSSHFRDTSLSLYGQYALSKKLMMANHYHYMNRASDNVAYSMTHPGIASTNIVSGASNSFPKWFSRLARSFMNVFTHNPEKAALGIVLLSSGDASTHGVYLVPRGPWEIRGYPVAKSVPQRLAKDAEVIHEKTLSYISALRGQR